MNTDEIRVKKFMTCIIAGDELSMIENAGISLDMLLTTKAEGQENCEY